MNSTFILKALAEETRLEIVRFLLTGKKNASRIVIHVKKSQPNTSLALRHLLIAGIIEQEKQGREVFYSVSRPDRIVALLEILDAIQMK
jgi:DNA-binding transcriptional ArsR family regulator